MSLLTKTVKSFWGRFEYIVNGISHPKEELLVLCYHGTQKKFMPSFEKQLDLLTTHFDFLHPSDLSSYYSGEIKSDRPLVLLTFDDGIKNNLYAGEVLKQRGIAALFFIIPDFVDTDTKDQEMYFKAHIRPAIDEHIDSLPEDKTAMSWEELRGLMKNGHFIGSHSSTHTMKASDAIVKNHKEIEESAVRILLNTGQRSAFFCAPNDSLLSCGKEQMQMIKKNYDFFFSTFPGSNAREKDKWFIKRSNVEISWSLSLFLQSIGKWDQKRWKTKRDAFRSTIG